MIQHYLAASKSLSQHFNHDALSDVRARAIAYLEKHDFPSTEPESWRYLNLTGFSTREFIYNVPSHNVSVLSSAKDAINHLMFMDGKLNEKIFQAHLEYNKQYKVTALPQFLKTEAETILPYFPLEFTDVFHALQYAFMREGLVIEVPAHAKIDLPLFINTTQSTNQLFANLTFIIILNEGSELSVCEQTLTAQHSTSFHNIQTIIIGRKDSRCNYYKMTKGTNDAFHFARTTYHPNLNSELHSFVLTQDGKITRYAIDTHLMSNAAKITCHGLFQAEQQATHAHHLKIHHAALHTQSTVSYRGIATDKARGIFDGDITVMPKASFTNAHMESKNLLLSADAEIDTKPQLFIYNDNIQCSHGATVGQLDQDALFYLRSRGLSEQEAKTLLTTAFAAEFLKAIPDEKIRNVFEKLMVE